MMLQKHLAFLKLCCQEVSGGPKIPAVKHC